MKILVTGGTGYIGSHTVLELLEAGYETVIVDNLCNSSEESIRRVEKITGKKAAFYQADIRDEEALDRIFAEEKPDAVIHFAGLKAVGESVRIPLAYYDNNINGTLTLLRAMGKAGCKNIVFSSSATVYGKPETVPIREDFPLSATNPYGRTKLMIEKILGDLYVSDNSWNIILLRYFNPIGAHESGLIGEDPDGIPNNLLPYIAKVAVGRLDIVHVFGNDYDTPDGTGVRDYIHVVDLAKGHVKACDYAAGHTGSEIINLGTGRGYSVLDLVSTFTRVNGVPVPYEFAPRRPGDIAENYADPSKAEKLLGWKAEKTLEDMCRDTYRFQHANPKGYRS